MESNRMIKRNTTHGKKYTRLYRIYRGMNSRCYNKNYNQYYLLSNEPKHYDIRVKDLGIVDFKLPSGKVIKAIKIQTIPSFGLFTGIMAKLVPPTFLWYEAQEPHNFLQYEGLETGVGGAVITSTVMQRMPVNN